MPKPKVHIAKYCPRIDNNKLPNARASNVGSSAAATIPAAKPTKYCCGVCVKVSSPPASVHSPRLKNSAICTAVDAYIPTPKKAMLPKEL